MNQMPAKRLRLAAPAVMLVAVFSLAASAQESPFAPPEAPPAEPDSTPAIVVRVDVQGNKTIRTERILSQLKTFPNRPYSKDVVRDDVQRLYATNWFYDVAADETRTPEGYIVTYHVIERPLIQGVRFLGNKKITDKELREITGLAPGKAMDPGLNRTMGSRILELYHEKGFPFASVELIEGGKQGDAMVVFQIVEGPKSRIWGISFEGNQFVSGQRLRTVVDNKNLFYVMPLLYSNYTEEAVSLDLIKLKDYYRNHGYLDVRVARKIDFSQGYDRAHVKYVIEEGPRYQIRNVRFAGNSKLASENLSKDLHLKDGKYFNRDRMESDIQLVRDSYGSRGYITTVVNADVKYLEEPGKVDLVYQVQEDIPKKIGEIRIRGNEHTKDRVIRQLLEVAPGETADTTKLRLSQFRLTDSRLFKVDPASGSMPTVEFDPNNDPADEFQDVLVRVEEDATGSLMLGVGVNSDSGVGGSLVLNERNFDLFRFPTSFSDLLSGHAFRGAGQELRIEAVPGNLVHRYAVTFSEPSLFGTDYRMTTSGYYFRRFYQAWAEQRMGGRLTVGKRFTQTIGGSLTARLEDVLVDNVVVPTPPDLAEVVGHNFVSSIRLGLDHDTRDSRLNPTKGHYIEAGFEQAFGDFTFPRLTLSGRQFWTMYERGDGSGKNVLSASVDVGWSGDDTPAFERFYAGGFQTMRGFQFRGVSPTQLGVEVGGNFQLLTRLEYFLPLSADDNIGTVFFVDAGTVESNVEILDYRVAPGFGLRVRVPGMGPVPLAFDFGFPVVKGPFDDTQVFSFFVGYFR